MKDSITSASREQLVALIRQINFGRIESLHISGGQPVLDPLPRIIREIKFGSESIATQQYGPANHTPKQNQELFALLTQIDNGVIEVLEVRHGLPFRVVIADSVPGKVGT